VFAIKNLPIRGVEEQPKRLSRNSRWVLNFSKSMESKKKFVSLG
jgi:hypothetical protein